MPTGQEQAQIEREIVAELGTRQAAGLKENAPSRIVGVLVRNGDDWDRAFEHIADHFGPNPQKRKHNVYVKKYRSKEALRQLLLEAARKPSEIRLTKLRVHDAHLGKPAVEVVRQFGVTIGEEIDQEGTKSSKELRRLRMFIDFQGNLITAYPAE